MGAWEGVGSVISLAAALITCVFIICEYAKGYHERELDHRRARWKQANVFKLSVELEAKLKDFDELKKKVDGLSLRVGIR